MKNETNTALITLGDMHTDDFVQDNDGKIRLLNGIQTATKSNYRDYFTFVTDYKNHITTDITASQLNTMYNMEAVGTGASVADAGATYGTPQYRLFRLIATPSVANTTTNTLYTIPTSYIRHELPIQPGENHQYLLNMHVQAGTEITAEVWVCDPVTGVPAARLYANCTTTNDAHNQGSQTVQRSPYNESGIQDTSRSWIGFEIPKTLIDAYATNIATIKLAIRPGMDNLSFNISALSSTLYISGYAMCVSKHALTVTPAFTYENTANIMWIRSASSGSNNYPVWKGMLDGTIVAGVPNDTTINLFIPLPTDSTKIYLTCLNVQRDSVPESGHLGMASAQWFVSTPTLSNSLGRPRLDVVAPSTGIIKRGLYPVGVIVDLEKYKNLLVRPANSGIRYLPLVIVMPNVGYDAMFGGFVTEDV